MFEKDNEKEIIQISDNLAHFFKDIIDFISAICSFFGFDPFAE